MMIEVVFPDGKRGEVEPQALQVMIENKEIASFRRSSGWVLLGRDPVRTNRIKVFCIPERRSSELSVCY